MKKIETHVLPCLRRWLAPLAALACSGGGAARDAAVSDAVLCEEKLSLVDHARWTLVASEDDPFDPPPAPDGGDGGGGTMSRPPCGEDDVHALTVGGEPALAVQTASCNWATVEQPSRVGVEAGEPLAYRVWYYSQDAFAGATEAETSVVLGDETIA